MLSIIGGSEKDAIGLRQAGVGRKPHCLPLIMRAHNKLGLDLDTHIHSLYSAHTLRTLLYYCHSSARPH